MKDGQKYSIKLVTRRTGLSPDVIRVWEKRYKAVTPERTATNRRLYSEADIERLILLHKATKAGHAIGQVANQPMKNLRQLLHVEEAMARSRKQPAQRVASDASQSVSIVDACIHHVKQLDAEGLKRALQNAEITLSKPAIIEQLIVPLMHKIGDLWRNGTLRVIHEHMASAVVRSFLGNLQQAFEIPATAPGIVITTPIGQLHELGALMAAATASSEGWRVTYLGPNLPAEEIAAAVRQNNAKAVGLSIVYPSDDLRMSEEMRKLRRGVSNKVAILAGGRVAASYQEILESIEAMYLKDMVSFGDVLESLHLR
jgi:methanogenic corrinoid protein MtbC1